MGNNSSGNEALGSSNSASANIPDCFFLDLAQLFGVQAPALDASPCSVMGTSANHPLASTRTPLVSWRPGTMGLACKAGREGSCFPVGIHFGRGCKDSPFRGRVGTSSALHYHVGTAEAARHGHRVPDSR